MLRYCSQATRAYGSAAGAAGLVHAAATWLDNYKAVVWAMTAKDLGSPKQTDEKQMVKEWRAELPQ